MSNAETTLGRLQKAWAAKPQRSYWPLHLEPRPNAEDFPDLVDLSDLEAWLDLQDQLDLQGPPQLASFLVNADDTPRFREAA